MTLIFDFFDFFRILFNIICIFSLFENYVFSMIILIYKDIKFINLLTC